LLLAQLGIAGGFLGLVGGYFISLILGELADRGIIQIDITLDALEQAKKDPKWRAAAVAVYAKASKGAKTEEEKIEIRAQYQKILADYATLGDGNPIGMLVNDQNPQS
jgi:hypothetical protein